MTEHWDGDLTGAVLAGRYVIGSLLGSGGMAEVYRAFDRELTRSVAVKVFMGSATPDDAKRLEREALMLSDLRCPGVVEVYDAGSHTGHPYYVMPEIKGGTLRQRMRGPLPPAFVARIGAQVADSLAHVHEFGVVHRDIKPSNILLDDDAKRSYLADFGLALAAEFTRFTKSGVLVGTAGYLAPEQVRGSTVSSKADVYALALVMLECLTGRAEYPGGDAEAALARLSRRPWVPRTLPAEWVALLTRMTELEPENRPSAEECVKALKAIKEVSKGVPALAPLEGDPPVSVDDDSSGVNKRSHRLGYALSAAAAAAVAGVVVVVVANLGNGGKPANGDPGTTEIIQLPGETVSVPVSNDTITFTPPGAPKAGSSTSADQEVSDDEPGTTETVTVTKKRNKDDKPPRTRTKTKTTDPQPSNGSVVPTTTT